MAKINEPNADIVLCNKFSVKLSIHSDSGLTESQIVQMIPENLERQQTNQNAVQECALECAGSSEGPDGLRSEMTAVHVEPAVNAAPQPGGMSVSKTVFTLLCQVVGTSDLSLPYAVKEGSILSLVLLALLPFLCVYTSFNIVKCLYETDQGSRVKRRTTYGDLAEACWPRHGRKVMMILHSTMVLMLSSLYLVLCGSFLAHAFPNLPLDRRMWTAIGTFVIMPFVLPKSLSKIAWASIVGVAAVLVAIGVIVYYTGTRAADWDIQSVVFYNTEGIPIALNIIILTYGGHAVLPRIEQGMLRRDSYTKVILYTYIIAVLIKFPLALVGYLTFTNLTKQVITNNLPSGVMTVIATCFLGVEILCTYPFLIYIVSNSIEDVLPGEGWVLRFSSRVRYISIRIFLILLTLLAALLIPQFGILIAFIGSIGGSAFVFILPGLFNLRLRYNETRSYTKVIDVFVVVFGFCSSVFGIYFTSKKLVSK